MWTRTDVDAMLRAYKTENGRYRHLRVEEELCRIKYDRMHRAVIIDEAAPRAQVITDMPRGGNRVGSTVEDVAVKLADGWMPPELKAVYQEWKSVEAKLERCETTVRYVEAWLAGLTERERWIVQHQFIDGEYWADVIDDYDRMFDKGLSKDTLKRLKDRALARIYEAAGCEE